MLKRLTLLIAALGLITGCASATVQPATPPSATLSEVEGPADTTTPSPVPPTPTLAPSDTPTPESSPSLEPSPTLTPEPTLPAVPSGMTVERLNPALYAVRATTPGTNVRAEPSAQAEVIVKFECGTAPLLLDAIARGAASASGPAWYHVADGGWIREDVIQTYPDANQAADAAKAATCAASAGTGGETDYTPATQSVWNFAQGQDNLTGTCSTGPILPPYGLVQITPGGDTLTWKSQEPAPYVFGKLKTNLYAYSGPTALGDGTVTMSLTFTSATTLQMSRAFVPNSDPACTHTHFYSGTFQWSAP
jgi:hypothetical protein